MCGRRTCAVSARSRYARTPDGARNPLHRPESGGSRCGGLLYSVNWVLRKTAVPPAGRRARCSAVTSVRMIGSTRLPPRKAAAPGEALRRNPKPILALLTRSVMAHAQSLLDGTTPGAAGFPAHGIAPPADFG